MERKIVLLSCDVIETHVSQLFMSNMFVDLSYHLALFLARRSRFCWDRVSGGSQKSNFLG